MAHERLPRARAAADLVIEELPDELLVYDRKRQKAHCLNQPVAVVFRLCDGEKTIADAAAALAQAGLPAEPEVVELAVAELQRARLVEVPGQRPTETYLRSRRQMLKKMGVVAGGALLLPLIQSIVAPSVARAASCGAKGTNCTLGTQCCSGICFGGHCK